MKNRSKIARPCIKASFSVTNWKQISLSLCLFIENLIRLSRFHWLCFASTRQVLALEVTDYPTAELNVQIPFTPYVYLVSNLKIKCKIKWLWGSLGTGKYRQGKRTKYHKVMHCTCSLHCLHLSSFHFMKIDIVHIFVVNFYLNGGFFYILVFPLTLILEQLDYVDLWSKRLPTKSMSSSSILSKSFRKFKI